MVITQKKRSAFTLLELIFAIIIISVTVLALPTVLLSTAASQEQTLKDEGIMLTSTKVAQVLTFPWDQQSSPDTGSLMSTSQVLSTDGDGDFNRSGITSFRVGHFPEKLRRRLSPLVSERNASAIGGTNNIGAFDGTSVQVGTAGSDRGYKKQYQLNTSVQYISDTAIYNPATGSIINFDYNTTVLAGTTSNIKMVTVSTQEKNNAGEWVNIIQMTSFSSNIGEAEFFMRRY